MDTIITIVGIVTGLSVVARNVAETIKILRDRHE